MTTNSNDGDKTHTVELTQAEVEIIKSLVEQQHDSGDTDPTVEDLLTVFEALTNDDEWWRQAKNCWASRAV